MNTYIYIYIYYIFFNPAVIFVATMNLLPLFLSTNISNTSLANAKLIGQRSVQRNKKGGVRFFFMPYPCQPLSELSPGLWWSNSCGPCLLPYQLHKWGVDECQGQFLPLSVGPIPLWGKPPESRIFLGASFCCSPRRMHDVCVTTSPRMLASECWSMYYVLRCLKHFFLGTHTSYSLSPITGLVKSVMWLFNLQGKARTVFPT